MVYLLAAGPVWPILLGTWGKRGGIRTVRVQRVGAWVQASSPNRSQSHPMESATRLSAGHHPNHVIVASVTCVISTFVAITLAQAALYMDSRVFRGITALSFTMQSVFALHFCDMVGLDFGVPWGFDLVWTVVSCLFVAGVATAGVYLAIGIRHDLEQPAELAFRDDHHKDTVAFHARYAATWSSHRFRLATSICRLRHNPNRRGPTEPHAGRSTFLLSSGGAGGGYY